MKYIEKLLVAGLIVLYTGTLYSQDAVQYMEKIGAEFNKIKEDTWNYTRTAAHSKNLKRVEDKRKELLNAYKTSIIKVKKMPGYNGDELLRDSVIMYLEMSYAVMNEDYSNIVDLETIAEESYDAMEAYMKAQEIAQDKLDAAWDVVDVAYKTFAEKNNINLVDKKDQTSEKLEKAGEVYKYYKEFYLAFFKPAKQEFYLMEAMQRMDVNSIKQNQQALAQLAKESKEKIKPYPPYKGNATLKVTCDDVMDFYIYEAETKGNVIIDFFLKKEKLEKLKEIMDKKGKNATKKEVDEYNNAVTDFNKMVGLYNSLNNDLSKRRELVLDKFYTAASKLFERHIAKK